MTEKDLFFAIGGIDEKWLSEAETEKYTHNKKQNYKKMLPVAACLAVALAAVSLCQSGVLKNTKTPSPPVTSAALTASTGDNTETDGAIALPPETTIPDSSSVYGDPSGGEYGITGGFFIPALPQDKTIKVSGEKITEEEAQHYLSDNLSSLASALTASGVNADNAHFSEKGYCHVSYSGKEGESLTVNEGFRDYLLFSGDCLIAIVTLFKENGTIYSTPSFGGAWFDSFNAFLNRHKGEELVFIYCGMRELVITPDNTVYITATSDSHDGSVYFEGIDNPYSLLYHPSDVYVP